MGISCIAAIALTFYVYYGREAHHMQGKVSGVYWNCDTIFKKLISGKVSFYSEQGRTTTEGFDNLGYQCYQYPDAGEYGYKQEFSPHFWVYFISDKTGKEYLYRADSWEEFQQFVIEQQYVAAFNSAGTIVKIHPLD